MVNIAKFFLEFTVDESCGKCPPCRIGTRRMLEMLTRITEGKGEPGTLKSWRPWPRTSRRPPCAAWARQPPTRCFPPSGISGMSTRPILTKSAAPLGCARPCSTIPSIRRSAKAAPCAPVSAPPAPSAASAGGPYHRQQQVRQVRRLYGSVQIRRHQPEIIPLLAKETECRRLLWAPALFYARWVRAGGIGRNRDIRYSRRYSRRRISPFCGCGSSRRLPRPGRPILGRQPIDWPSFAPKTTIQPR